MARAKHFLRGLSTSYLVLAANTLWTLVSLPVALHYLPRAEYTVWLIVAQVAVYFAMIDLGTSGAGTRLLVDHKDARDQGEYGSLIRSMWLLGLGQAVVILVAGLAGAKFLPAFFDNIPPELTGQFQRLWIWQVIFLAAQFALRIGNQILQAHQRVDLSNYAQMISFLVNLAGLIWGLESGWGLDSFIFGQGLAALILVTVPFLACWRLGLLPARGAWGRFSRAHLRQVFGLGSEFFLIIVGTTLTTGSQIFLLTRCLERNVALEAVLVWSVMTKLHTLGTQIAWRIVSAATPGLAEMTARGENERLWRRYRTVVEVSVLASGYLALLILLGNNAFVGLWTRQPITWPVWNNALLAVWFVLLTQACCHTSIILTLKEVGWLKLVYLAEGLLFVALAAAVIPHGGITGMLACSIVATCLLAMPYLNRRIAALAGVPLRTVVVEWSRPLLRFLAIMLPAALALAWLTRDSAWGRLLGGVGPAALFGAWVAVRFCLPPGLRTEVLERVPSRWRTAALCLLGRPTVTL